MTDQARVHRGLQGMEQQTLSVSKAFWALDQAVSARSATAAALAALDQAITDLKNATAPTTTPKGDAETSADKAAPQDQTVSEEIVKPQRFEENFSMRQDSYSSRSHWGSDVKKDASKMSSPRGEEDAVIATRTSKKGLTGERTSRRRDFHTTAVVDAEEELAFFENLQRVRKTFQDNDLNNDGVITAEELRFIAQKHGAQVYDTENIGRLIEELKLIARNRGATDERLEEEGIPFEIFATILYSKDTDDEVDSELQDSVKALRNFFRDCGNARMLAEAADVAVWEINNNERKLSERILQVLDPVMGVIIFVNAALIGISMDMDDPPVFEYLEFIFVVCYVIEVGFKLWHFGAGDFFLGTEWSWHWLDATLAAIGIIHLVLSLISSGVDLGVLMYLRLFRVTRLVRLVRLTRAFKDLSIMVMGLLAGLRTMMWAMLLLSVIIYSLALVLTMAVGKDDTSDMPYKKELFSTVPKSMFTIYVCLTDGCANYDGTPISLHLFDRYGWRFFIAYIAGTVVVTFGLFNLIMAIFVENTMEAAKSNDTAIAAARHKENLRVARKLKLVIRQFTAAQSAGSTMRKGQMIHEVEQEMKGEVGLRGYLRMLISGEGREKGGLTTSSEGVSMLTSGEDELQLSRSQFEDILVTKPVQQLMDELEIDETDRKGLFDVLDADNSGSLTIEELVSGLMAVRGQAKKSDTVATMLAVKAVQKSLRNTAALLIQNCHLTNDKVSFIEEMLNDRLEALETNLNNLRSTLPVMMRRARARV